MTRIRFALGVLFCTVALVACGNKSGQSATPTDCSAGNFEGCSCDPAVDREQPCYEGDPGTEDVGSCVAGVRTCNDGTSTWSACVDQVIPTSEICDNFDNDCDSRTDEDSVQSTCGISVGDDPFPIEDPNVDSTGVGLDENGDLVLDSATVENHFLWIANDAEGTVSKIDTRTGQEVARYASVSREVIVDHTGGAGAIAGWNEDTNGDGYSDNRASRTAVDIRGDVWVANRAFGRQPSATKIANVEADCVDRNGNGEIDTSTDANGDGVITLADPAEFLAESDECIRFTVVVGANDGTARAVAIGQALTPGAPGDAWVGMYNEQAFYQLDGDTGALVQRVPPAGPIGISPYGAAIDSQGRLWAPNGCCGTASLTSIDTLSNPATYAMTPIAVPDLGAAGSYGIVVDTQDRVWIGGWPEGALKRYNPADGTTVIAQIPGSFGAGWGVRGLGIDIHGNVWAALHASTSPFTLGRMARIDADTTVATGSWDITDGQVPVGIGVDFDGDVWTVNQTTSNASRMHIDQTSLEPAPHPTTGNMIDTFPVGRLPYTYSDFTGLSLRTVTTPIGDYIVPLQGCAATNERAQWSRVEFDATTPANTSVEIWVRSGDNLDTIAQEPIFGPWTMSPADLQMPPGPVPDGRYLQLTIRLLSQDNESTPIVHGYAVDWGCPSEPVE